MQAVFLFLKKLYLFNLFERQRESIHPLRCPQQIGLGKSKARRLEVKPALPCGRQGPLHLSHHLLPLRVHVSRELEKERSQDLNPGTGMWDARVAGSSFAALNSRPGSSSVCLFTSPRCFRLHGVSGYFLGLTMESDVGTSSWH